MQGEPIKCARTSRAGRANPTRILHAKRGAGLCGVGQPALSPLLLRGQILPAPYQF